MAFSLGEYDLLLATIAEARRTVVGVATLLDPDHASDPARMVLVRHDVDRLPSRAVQMAALEARRGLSTTYYFRWSSSGFPERPIRAIAELGHEVGYHYETLSHCRGHTDDAVRAFAYHLEAFRKIAPCLTVSMHGAPFSRHDNQRLMDLVDPVSVGLRGDAVRHTGKFRPVYVTDTGGSWNAARTRNRRDFAGERVDSLPDPGNRQAFRQFLERLDRLVYINAHPERWPTSRLGRVQSGVTDGLINMLKYGISLLHPTIAHGDV